MKPELTYLSFLKTAQKKTSESALLADWRAKNINKPHKDLVEQEYLQYINALHKNRHQNNDQTPITATELLTQLAWINAFIIINLKSPQNSKVSLEELSDEINQKIENKNLAPTLKDKITKLVSEFKTSLGEELKENFNSNDLTGTAVRNGIVKLLGITIFLVSLFFLSLNSLFGDISGVMMMFSGALVCLFPLGSVKTPYNVQDYHENISMMVSLSLASGLISSIIFSPLGGVANIAIILFSTILGALTGNFIASVKHNFFPFAPNPSTEYKEEIHNRLMNDKSTFDHWNRSLIKDLNLESSSQETDEKTVDNLSTLVDTTSQALFYSYKKSYADTFLNGDPKNYYLKDYKTPVVEQEFTEEVDLNKLYSNLSSPKN